MSLPMFLRPETISFQARCIGDANLLRMDGFTYKSKLCCSPFQMTFHVSFQMSFHVNFQMTFKCPMFNDPCHISYYNIYVLNILFLSKPTPLELDSIVLLHVGTSFPCMDIWTSLPISHNCTLRLSCLPDIKSYGLFKLKNYFIF